MIAYILAGGLSRRFGSDKALFPVDGVPLLVRTAQVLTAAGLEPVIVARAPRNFGIPEMLEPDGPRHPLWGVAHALGRGEDAFFTPCDVVDLRSDQVRALVDARAVALGQPLLGVWPARLASDARNAALSGARVASIASALPTLDVGPLTNLNSPPGS